ncbi:hypothetical protein BELL_1568g00020 [Botrytis elliptica]|uniref:Uncharacterized protein n=1 Tax=Botrytis elliptica TaxID=278938 RepID=A0A4Z1HWY1_9HELO|nr:hypothetical protein BELL_1568g00020 [Botrytis elliptica]
MELNQTWLGNKPRTNRNQRQMESNQRCPGNQILPEPAYQTQSSAINQGQSTQFSVFNSTTHTPTPTPTQQTFIPNQSSTRTLPFGAQSSKPPQFRTNSSSLNQYDLPPLTSTTPSRAGISTSEFQLELQQEEQQRVAKQQCVAHSFENLSVHNTSQQLQQPQPKVSYQQQQQSQGLVEQEKSLSPYSRNRNNDIAVAVPLSTFPFHFIAGSGNAFPSRLTGVLPAGAAQAHAQAQQPLFFLHRPNNRAKTTGSTSRCFDRGDRGDCGDGGDGEVGIRGVGRGRGIGMRGIEEVMGMGMGRDGERTRMRDRHDDDDDARNRNGDGDGWNGNGIYQGQERDDEWNGDGARAANLIAQQKERIREEGGRRREEGGRERDSPGSNT